MTNRYRNEGEAGVAALERAIECDLGVEITLSLRSRPDHVVLHRVFVPEHLRGRGLASETFARVLGFADERGLPVALTASSDFGASKTRLEWWYRSLGFAKRTDYRFSEAMVRYPR